MKKILGVFSLIAICTVAFTSQASAKETVPDYAVVCDIGYEGGEVVGVEVVTLEVFYVTDETVNCTGEGGLIAESVTNVTGVDFILNYTLAFDKHETTDNCTRWVGNDWLTGCLEPADVGKLFVTHC